jgi:hypothetical protein
MSGPMSIPEIHDAIREAGGFVDVSGSVTFPNAERFIVAAVLCGETALVVRCAMGICPHPHDCEAGCLNPNQLED